MLAGAVVLGAVVRVDDHMRIGETRLPSLCTFRNLTGLPCAGCGLTRSWVSIAQGDLGRSLTYHRLGWLVMLYVLLQSLRHSLWFAVARWRAAVERGGRWLDRGIVLVGILLLIEWTITLVRIWQST